MFGTPCVPKNKLRSTVSEGVYCLTNAANTDPAGTVLVQVSADTGMYFYPCYAAVPFLDLINTSISSVGGYEWLVFTIAGTFHAHANLFTDCSRRLAVTKRPWLDDMLQCTAQLECISLTSDEDRCIADVTFSATSALRSPRTTYVLP